VSTSPAHVPAARGAHERRPGQLAQAPLPQRHRVWHDDPARRAVAIQALAAAAEPGEVAWFASPAGGRLVLGQVHGARTRALPGLAVAVGRGLTGKAAASARPERVDDYFAADTITHDFDRVVADESVARMLAVPVRCGDRVLGVVTVGARSPGHFSDRRIDAVTARARELEQALRLLDEHEQRLEAALARQRDDNTAWLNEQVASGVHGISAALGELRSLVGDDPAVAEVLARLERSTTDLGRVVRGPLGSQRAVRDPSAARPAGVDRKVPCSLTRRQRQILELVAQGCTNREIARVVGLAENTVKTYWQQALAELGARNRVEAISRAREAGLV
jgi:LuxR family transcriptional regulator, regulator of acetate metabolism